VTGKTAILYCGYHGGQDWFASQIIPSAGTTPQLVYPFEYNNIDSITDFFDKAKERFGEDNPVAAIIMEVPPEEPEPDFLQRVINIAHAHGALFILDEIVTGFRYSLGGAQELYGIMPDLACFGKGMANGFPISCVVGKKEIMQDFDKIFWSTTFGGDIGAIEASILTINTFLEKDVIGHIWQIGTALRKAIAQVLPDNAILRGNPARSLIEFKDDPDFVLKSLFLQEVAKCGVLMGVPIFPCFSHDMDDVKRTAGAISHAFRMCTMAQDPRKALVGEPLRMVGIRR
jgi:glutamate-1-semialdehyde aminotransferase